MRVAECKNGVWVKAQLVPTSLGIIGTLTGKSGPKLFDRRVCSPVLEDISAQKMYEESKLAHARESEMNAKRRAEEADERRRAQGKTDHPRPVPQTLPLSTSELLIDVTSHELR
jgi:hypothetical protein